jgi:AcrR family transcriptional regulator
MQSDRKSTQRDRLIAGMSKAVATRGYAAANIVHAIDNAGVSRPTFYEYFEDKDDCFQSVLVEANDRLLREMREGVRRVSREHAVAASLQALLRFADAQPEAARMLFAESMACGGAALDIRDRGLEEAQAMIEDAHADLPWDTPTPDNSSRAMLGGVYRLLAPRLRRGESASRALFDDLLTWVESYEQPRGRHRWRTLQAATLPSAVVPNLPPRFPAEAPPPPPASSGRTRDAVDEDVRLRILHAVAYIAEQRGYPAASIAEITKVAGVDSRVFYRHFGDKQRAFAAVSELYYQQLMAVTASAFIGGGSWPRRIWDAALASARYLEQNRNLAHVALVQSHAGGAEAVKRGDDSLMAFTLFLQEGYRDIRADAGGSGPAQVALEAIALTSWEIAYGEIRSRATPRLAGLSGHVSWLSLAPFLGARDANRFIAERLAEERARR